MSLMYMYSIYTVKYCCILWQIILIHVHVQSSSLLLIIFKWLREAKGIDFSNKRRPFPSSWMEGPLGVLAMIITNSTHINIIEWISNIKDGRNFRWVISTLSFLFVIIYNVYSIWWWYKSESVTKKRLEFFSCEAICPIIIAIVPLDTSTNNNDT